MMKLHQFWTNQPSDQIYRHMYVRVYETHNILIVNAHTHTHTHTIEELESVKDYSTRLFSQKKSNLEFAFSS